MGAPGRQQHRGGTDRKHEYLAMTAEFFSDFWHV
jgi:hypothetical protein